MMIINGCEAEQISALDRGLTYGDGVFRTMTAAGGRVRHFARHWRKLAEDCARMRLPLPAQDVVVREIGRLLQKSPDGVVKVTITRGPGARGYAVAPDAAPTRIVAVSSRPAWTDDRLEEGVRARVCALRLSRQPLLAGIKHLNRLENVLARMEWDDPGIAEGLLLDMDELVIEGTMSNVFARFGRTLITPDLSACGVAGVMRDLLLERAAGIGLDACVGQMNVATLMTADEVMVVNSVIGVWQVRRLDHKNWTKGEWTPRLRNLIEEEQEGDLAPGAA